VTLVVSVSLALTYYFIRHYELNEAALESIHAQLRKREEGEVFRVVDPLMVMPSSEVRSSGWW